MAHWRNTSEQFGIIAIAFHWLIALTVFGMFGLGLYMVGLDYYDSWYRQGPLVHKTIGVVLFALLVLRLAWRFANPQPKPLGSKRWEHLAAHAVHMLLYLLLFALMFSGYLISTADGRPLETLLGFGIPATLQDIENQEDIAGDIHAVLAWVIIALALLHAAAALKHHFIDKDRTLLRMLGRS